MIHNSFNQYYKEDAAILTKSANLFDNEILLYCPQECRDFLESFGLKFHWRECPYIKSSTKVEIVNADMNSPFYKQKYGNFETTVRDFGSATYVGADIIFVDHCELDFPMYDVALTPHHISYDKEHYFGRYNADFIWTSTPKLFEWLRQNMHRSTYSEQHPFTFAREAFIVKELDMGYNMGWYRFSPDHNSFEVLNKRMTAFSSTDEGIFFGNEKVKFFHTHLINRGEHDFCNWFSALVKHLLSEGNSKLKELGQFIKDL